jgi:phosphatidylglycerol:prolipoprotein diacylglycerol transferase
MWALRKKLLGALKMFGLYLILAGIERFLVERIRVNYEYDWGFIHPSQAEILSVLMVITGLFLMLVYKDKEPATVKPGWLLTA